MPYLCSSNGKKPWHTLSIIYSINPRGYPSLAAISLGQAVCAKLVQNMINDSCHHLFSELQHAEFKEAFNEFDKVRIYIKSVNLQYNTLGRLDNGTNESLTKSPSVIFFYTFYRFRALKTLYSYFCNFIKEIRNSIQRIFSKNFARNHEKK